MGVPAMKTDSQKFVPRPSVLADRKTTEMAAGELGLKVCTIWQIQPLLKEGLLIPSAWTRDVAGYRRQTNRPKLLGESIRCKDKESKLVYELIVPENIVDAANALVLFEPSWMITTSTKTGKDTAITFMYAPEKGSLVLPEFVARKDRKKMYTDCGAPLSPMASAVLGMERVVGVERDWVGFPVVGSSWGNTANNGMLYLNALPSATRGALLVGEGEPLVKYLLELGEFAKATMSEMRRDQIANGLTDAFSMIIDELSSPLGYMGKFLADAQVELGKARKWGVVKLDEFNNLYLTAKVNERELAKRE